jgi:hypothetical protein
MSRRNDPERSPVSLKAVVLLKGGFSRERMGLGSILV